MTVPSIQDAVLDHVAHAVPTWQQAWTRYAVDLGAEWSSGGPGPGFAPGQLRFANRARIELLMPDQIEVNDFLDRFLTRHGPGPHHLTFKVGDLDRALHAVASSGFEAIGVDLTHPEWREAFIHPRQATGVVIQLAQAEGEWSSPPPDDYPTQRRTAPGSPTPVTPASLTRVVHVVADLEDAIKLFVGLLGGAVDDRGERPGERWVDLRWDGPLALRLVTPDAHPRAEALHQWLGDRAGRIHHLAVVADDPAGVPDARPTQADLPGIGTLGAQGASWTVEPEENLGLRLVLWAPERAGRGTTPGPLALT